MGFVCHPQTLFHLEPADNNTGLVLGHQDNTPFISMSSAGSPALEIGYHVSSRPRGGRIIAELGRDADLRLVAKDVSRKHIAFEVHPDSHAILLRIHAEKIRSVRVEPGGFRPDGSFRQLVLIPGEDYQISIGGSAQPLRFYVRWRLDALATELAVDEGFQVAQAHVANPIFVRTEEDDDSDIRTWYNTRLWTLTDSGSVRHALLKEQLGIGSYGSVHKAIDLDSGHLIAVKVVEPKGEKEKENIHREIKVLRRLHHEHIIEWLGHKGSDSLVTDESRIEIFMPLRNGSVRDLAPLQGETKHRLFRQILHEMLSALDYLACQNLCHQDVKPANILYLAENGKYKFELADFGLANYRQSVSTARGTKIFTAPELHRDYIPGKPRTPKMDVWSLFVTMASLMPETNFDEQVLNTGCYSDILDFVRATAAGSLVKLEAMAREDPELRASAAQMLVMCFQGEGLTTPRSDIGPIREVPVSAKADIPGSRCQQVSQANTLPLVVAHRECCSIPSSKQERAKQQGAKPESLNNMDSTKSEDEATKDNRSAKPRAPESDHHHSPVVSTPHESAKPVFGPGSLFESRLKAEDVESSRRSCPKVGKMTRHHGSKDGIAAEGPSRHPAIHLVSRVSMSEQQDCSRAKALSRLGQKFASTSIGPQ